MNFFNAVTNASLWEGTIILKQKFTKKKKKPWYCFYFAESLKIYLNRKHLVLTSAHSSSLSWCVSSGAYLLWESGPTLMCSWQRKKYLNNLRYFWLFLGLYWSSTDGSFFTCSGNVEHETCEGMVTTCGAWNRLKECQQLCIFTHAYFCNIGREPVRNFSMIYNFFILRHFDRKYFSWKKNPHFLCSFISQMLFLKITIAYSAFSKMTLCLNFGMKMMFSKVQVWKFIYF